MGKSRSQGGPKCRNTLRNRCFRELPPVQAHNHTNPQSPTLGKNCLKYSLYNSGTGQQVYATAVHMQTPNLNPHNYHPEPPTEVGNRCMRTLLLKRRAATDEPTLRVTREGT